MTDRYFSLSYKTEMVHIRSGNRRVFLYALWNHCTAQSHLRVAGLAIRSSSETLPAVWVHLFLSLYTVVCLFAMRAPLCPTSTRSSLACVVPWTGTFHAWYIVVAPFFCHWSSHLVMHSFSLICLVAPGVSTGQGGLPAGADRQPGRG